MNAADASAGSRTTVLADWNDVQAAVWVAISAIESAQLSVRERSPDEREFELLTVLDEPAWVMARREPPTAAGDAKGGEAPVMIELTARVSRTGDSEREARLLRALCRRLIDLRGVDFRPVR